MQELNWVHPNTITGDAATGDRYLRRQRINNQFWREVKKGNHILFVAPRRVGKTSVMKDLEENCPDGFFGYYENIESADTRNRFFERLFHLVLQCVHWKARMRSQLSLIWKRYEISELGKTLKINRKETDYETELRILIQDLADLKITIVLFIDEFAEVIYKINKNGKPEDALAILHTVREFRHNEDFRHIKMVLAGSIGLHYVVKQIDRSKLINDLHPIEIDELTPAEAKKLVQLITKDATMLLEPRQAFENVARRNSHFEDWVKRLKNYMGNNFAFVNEVLTACAHRDTLGIHEVYKIARKHERQEDYMELMEELMRDGYITETEGQRYRFLSPFLQNFWKRKHPIYHDE